jgi:hypothetical protein
MFCQGRCCQRSQRRNRARHDYVCDPHLEALLVKAPYSQKDFAVFLPRRQADTWLLNELKIQGR